MPKADNHIRKYHYGVIIGLLVLMSDIVYAQSFRVNLEAKDKITHRSVPVICNLYRFESDSSLHRIEEMRCPTGDIGFTLPDVASENQYWLEVIGGESVERLVDRSYFWDVEPTDEYDSQMICLDIPEDATSPYQAPPVFLERHREKQLGEVTVTATKVLFYHKGDTLIYNADAFVLAEGSMLDALISQMPGVELKSNGEIFCNGKKINDLLLNGRDLFNGNRELMLENLAAYTVKDIAVYDKRGRMGTLMDYNTGDESHVMDVRLKRHYLHGWLLNADLGYGTHNRYLAKLFGMWFSENVSLSAYSGVNNLSDQNTPGKSDESWTTDNMDSGVSTQQQGGIIYNAHGFEDRWELKGDVNAMHASTESTIALNTENFTNSGSFFDYAWKMGCNKDFSVSTNHNIFTKIGSKANMEVSPKFRYNSGKSDMNDISASFRDEVKNMSSERIMRIYSDGSNLSDIMMNRIVNEDATREHGISTSVFLNTNLRMREGKNPNALSFDASVSYDNNIKDYFNRYTLNYGSNQMAVESHHRYYREHPDFNMKWDAQLAFRQFVDYKSIQLPLYYKYSYNQIKRTSDMYLIPSSNEMPGADIIYSIPEADYNNLWVPQQSFKYLQTDHSQAIRFAPMHMQVLRLSSSVWMILSGDAQICFTHRRLDYNHDQIPQNIVRQDVNMDVDFHAQFGKYRNNEWGYIVNLRYKVIPVDMLMLVDRPDKNPTVTMLGNPDLNDSQMYSVYFRAEKQTVSQVRNTFHFELNYMDNAIDNAYTIDSQTGRFTYQPFNVNGNMDISGDYELYTLLGAKRKFSLTNKSLLNYRRNISHYSDIVQKYGIEEQLKITWMYKRYRVGIYGNAQMNTYTHSNHNYYGFTAWTCKYGTDAVLNLPREWSVSTDLNLYTRRGYADRALNTSDVVWNARVSKSVLKGALVFAIDGYDLLQQLSNVTYTINAQARTETVSNVIPSYLLFHVCYRFNRNPGKK